MVEEQRQWLQRGNVLNGEQEWKTKKVKRQAEQLSWHNFVTDLALVWSGLCPQKVRNPCTLFWVHQLMAKQFGRVTLLL